jgi:hypothetical protein
MFSPFTAGVVIVELFTRNPFVYCLLFGFSIAHRRAVRVGVLGGAVGCSCGVRDYSSSVKRYAGEDEVMIGDIF